MSEHAASPTRALEPSLDRVYRNAGNAPLIDLLNPASRVILDVGCGAGDNAALIKSRQAQASIYGITQSAPEAEIAGQFLTGCWLLDAEGPWPAELSRIRFDAIIFSHVLEHLREPDEVLQRFSHLLSAGGELLIAVPNTLSWRMRWQFLRGNFEYQAAGVLDNTHLRFFTYLTADKYLLGKCRNLRLVSKTVSGSVPLWWLRRYVLPRRWSAYIDRLGCRLWPNLFGGQVLLKVVHD
jgi:2-polyprenyl-3-methyl-5-hydroxy-6-metoxy-1,4-benzoquinol methylase